MGTFKLRHKVTGEFVIGTYDKVPCVRRADTFFDGGNAGITVNYTGKNVVWWDCQEWQVDVMTDEAYYVLEGGDVVGESELERVYI